MGIAMWVNNEQRDRIFQMIGTQGVSHRRVPAARLEQQRAGILIWLGAVIVIGVAILAL